MSYKYLMRDFIMIVNENFESLGREDLIEAIIDETIIPETDYGYWIDPFGKIITVPNDLSHSGVLHTVSHEYEDWETTRGFQIPIALRKGWIRIVIQGNRRNYLNVEIDGGCPTQRSVSALRRLVAANAFESFALDIEWDSSADHILELDDEARDAIQRKCVPHVYKDVRPFLTAVQSVSR